LDEAIENYRIAIRLNPDYAYAFNNLGNALAARGQWEEAARSYRRAVQLMPTYSTALNNLGVALAAQGKYDESIQSYRKAMQFNPKNSGPYLNLGITLGQMGRTREAVTQYREALKLDPDLTTALNNLAWALATSPDDQLRNGDEAVRLAEHACELTHYGQPWFVGTLAAAYAEAGRFPEAVTAAEKAGQIATVAGQPALVMKERQLLELYRARKPYHEPPPAK
jgi:superkiller protein 3